MPAASGPHRVTARGWRARAAADGPDTSTQTGAPSTVSRSARHVAGTKGGTGPASTPGIPNSAMPIGRATGTREL